MDLDWDTHYVDATVVRAHQHAAGAVGGQAQEALGRSRGGFPTRIQLRAEGGGKPLAFVVSGGERHESRYVEALLARRGIRVRPRAWGATVLSVSIGDRSAATGVHVYAPATTLEGLDREPRLIAVPVRLAPGEMRRWPLPPGGWSLSMWPEEDEGRGPHLRIEGASCGPMPGISRRRFGCWSTHGASVVVYAPWRAGATSVLTGILAVKPDGETERETRARRASVVETP